MTQIPLMPRSLFPQVKREILDLLASLSGIPAGTRYRVLFDGSVPRFPIVVEVTSLGKLGNFPDIIVSGVMGLMIHKIRDRVPEGVKVRLSHALISRYASSLADFQKIMLQHPEWKRVHDWMYETDGVNTYYVSQTLKVLDVAQDFTDKMVALL